LREKIIGLILLQECDNQIAGLDSIKRDYPAKIQKLENALDACRTSFQVDSDKLESLKKERRKTEQLTQELDGKIEKSKIKLSNIKSNKEYTAALKEIEDLTKEKTKVEDGIIRFMEEIEVSEKKCLENKDQLDKLQKNFDLDKKQVEQKLEELNKESEALGGKRQEILKSIDRELLGKYDFLKARKGGLAIGPVVGGVCQLCHLNIPPQNFNELIRGNSLMSCPNCNRLIYWGEDEYFMKELGNAPEKLDE
jgi:predicted  nucleic acid-binding Zn-ribbon protein